MREIVTKKCVCVYVCVSVCVCVNVYRFTQVMLTVALLWYQEYCRISVHKELPHWTYDFERHPLRILVGVL